MVQLKNVQDRKNNHEGEGFYGTMYYAKTNNVHSAENTLLADSELFIMNTMKVTKHLNLVLSIQL